MTKLRFLKNYNRVKKDFFGMAFFMVECLVFQQNKVETIKAPGLLQPLSIPGQGWEWILMDFILGLLNSKGKSVIMVVVDIISKYTHFFHYITHLEPSLFLFHLPKQFKRYMETEILF